VPVIVINLGVALALAIGVIVNYQAEGKQKAFIKQAFKHYLGAEVIEQLITDPSRLKLAENGASSRSFSRTSKSFHRFPSGSIHPP